MRISKASLRTFLLGALPLTFIGAVVVACSDDDAHPAFGQPDSGDDTNSTDAGDASAEASPDTGTVEQRPPFDPADEAVVCPTTPKTPCAVEIVAGSNRFCTRMNDGTVRCWGENLFGSLGGASPDGSDWAVREVENLTDAAQLSASVDTTCARRNDGSVYCWGGNTLGQLGLSADEYVVDYKDHGAAPVALTEAATRVDVGPRSACAVLASGKVWCWGDNMYGVLANAKVGEGGTGPTASSLDSIAVNQLAIGTATAFASTKTGDVVSWGTLGGKDALIPGRLSSVSPDHLPNSVHELHDVTSLAATVTLLQNEGGQLGPIETEGFGPFPGARPKHAHACALVAGEVYCWGKSDFGALCTGLPDAESTPAHAPVKGKVWPQRLAVGDEITCARMTDGTVQCCGDDTRGRLGKGSVSADLYSAFFTPASAFKGHAVQVAASNRAVCALNVDGTVECWGSNVYGELGTGQPDEDAHPTPVKVAF